MSGSSLPVLHHGHCTGPISPGTAGVTRLILYLAQKQPKTKETS